jgi:hypothetical protein
MGYEALADRQQVEPQISAHREGTGPLTPAEIGALTLNRDGWAEGGMYAKRQDSENYEESVEDSHDLHTCRSRAICGISSRSTPTVTADRRS